MNLNELKELNPHIEIKDVSSNEFKQYGNIVYGYDFSSYIGYMIENTIVSEDVVYVASVEEMEKLEMTSVIENELFGEMSVQIGYCNGNNQLLNAVEYHKGDEINIAVTDSILLLGKVQDIDNNVYSSENIEAFYVPAGTVLDIYGTTLHYAPVNASDKGFKMIVILPKGTNTDLEGDNYKEIGLFAKNKWLLCIEEYRKSINTENCGKVIGNNIRINL